jgi:hypothetical protein
MKGKDKELSDLVDEKNKLANELKVQYNVCTGPPRGDRGEWGPGQNSLPWVTFQIAFYMQILMFNVCCFFQGTVAHAGRKWEGIYRPFFTCLASRTTLRFVSTSSPFFNINHH